MDSERLSRALADAGGGELAPQEAAPSLGLLGQAAPSAFAALAQETLGEGLLATRRLVSVGVLAGPAGWLVPALAPGVPMATLAAIAVSIVRIPRRVLTVLEVPSFVVIVLITVSLAVVVGPVREARRGRNRQVRGQPGRRRRRLGRRPAPRRQPRRGRVPVVIHDDGERAQERLPVGDEIRPTRAAGTRRQGRESSGWRHLDRATVRAPRQPHGPAAKLPVRLGAQAAGDGPSETDEQAAPSQSPHTSPLTSILAPGARSPQPSPNTSRRRWNGKVLGALQT